MNDTFEFDKAQIDNTAKGIMTLALYNNFKGTDFDTSKACYQRPYFSNYPPQIKLSDNGFSFVAELRVDVLCTLKNDKIARAFTLVSNNLDFTGELVITEGFVLHLNNLNFDFKLSKIDNSVIGDFNLTLLNLFIATFKGAILLLVKAVVAPGVHLGWLLKVLNIDVIDLDKASLTPHD